MDEALLERFAARVVEVDAYARTWWAKREEPQLSFLQANPHVRLELLDLTARDQPVGTEDVYSTDHGTTWVGERLDLQAELLAQMDGTDAAAAEGGEARSIYFLLGLPGSGKSSSLLPIAMQHAGLNGRPPVVDADAVRVQIPEYAGGLGSGVVQAETAVLTYGRGHKWGDGRQDRVLLGEASVIMLDTIGDAKHLPRIIEQAVEQGRRIYVLRTECPVEVCRERAMRRALDNGRVVPLELIDAKIGFPEQALEAARATGLVDEWAVVNTAGKTASITSASADFADMTIADAIS